MNKQLLLFLCLLSPWWLQAQTGPAGIGNATGASGQPENILWLRANDLGLANGTPVTTWPDQSGNGNNMVQQGADAVPFFQNNGLSGSSFDVVRFDGTERYLFLGDNADLDDNMSGLTMIVVSFMPSIDASPRGLISKRNGSNNQDSYSLFTFSGQRPFFDVSGGGNNSRLDGGVALNNTTDYVITAIYDGTTQSMFVQSALGGSRAETGLVDNTTSNLYLGSLNNNYGTYFNGDIAEVILYKDALNGGQRIIVENYLAEKYGLAIGGNDYYTNANGFNADITGIGTANGTDKASVSGASDALSVSEFDNSLDVANEFVMIGHNSAVTHTNENATNDIPAAELGTTIIDHWNKEYYLETTGGVSIDMTFDFAAAGYTLGSVGNYVLLYRANTSSDYTRVPAIGYTSPAANQLTVSLPPGSVNTGYYTIAEGTPVTSRTWYVLTDGDWDNPITWTLDAGTAPGPNNPLNETPGVYDEIFIRNGKTVNITTDNKTIIGAMINGTLNVGTSSGHDFKLIEGRGTIKIQGDVANNDNFPAGNTTTPNGFADPTNGGLLIVEGNGMTLNNAHTFRNVRINTSNATDVVALGADIELNGDLTVRRGTFQFGDGTTTSRRLIVRGNVEVENNGSTQDGRISTAVANVRHEFDLYGDFLNEGTVAFSQRTAQVANSEATDGIVDLNLVANNQNQVISANGLSYFYRIEINKVSIDYIATFRTNSAGNFILTGPVNDDVNVDVSTPAQNTNALGLITGTVEIGTNVTINPLNNVGNYSIGSNAKLLINGGRVVKTGGAAIVPYGVLEIESGLLESLSGSGITTRDNGQFVASGGTTNIPQFRTSVLGADQVGGYRQSGGVVNIGPFTSAITGGGSASGSNNYYAFSLTYPGNSFIMSGGTLNVFRATTRGAIFINSDPGNINVTGGTVVMAPDNNTRYKVTSRAPFYNVTMRANGGNRSIFLEDGSSGNGAEEETLTGQPLVVLSDLVLEGNETNPAYGDLKFYATTSATNVNDVYIGGGFRLEEGTQYIACFPDFTTDAATDYTYNGVAQQPTNVNTTYFNQTIGTQAIEEVYWGNNRYYDYDGIDDGGPNGINEDNDENMLEMGNVVLNRTTGNELRLVSPNPGVNGGNRGNSALTWDINGNAEVLSGTLDQGRLTIRIWGNVVNNDRMGTYYSTGPYPTGGGTPNRAQIRFREDGNLTLTTQDGATFGNIRINIGVSNANPPLELTSDVIMERVEMMRGYIYLKEHNLRIDEMWNLDNDRNTNAPDNDNRAFFQDNTNNSLVDVRDETRHNAGATRPGEILFFTDGNKGDGGLTLKVTGNTVAEDRTSRVANTGPITFPVGFVLGNPASPIPSNTPIYVRPAQMKVKNYVSDGYVTVKPVSGELQTSNLAGGEILQNYWAVSHTFPAGNEPTVALRFFYYNQTGVAGVDLPAAAANEANYVPGYVLDGGAFTRIYESDANTGNTTADGPNDVTDVDETNPVRTITFNGPDTNGEFTQAGFTGFTLVNANFTTGEPDRFVGAPEVYYSRATNGAWWEWQETNHWSTDPVNKHIGAPAGSAPGPGDIAVVGSEYVNQLTGGGYVKTGDGRHQIRIDNTAGDITVAEIRFDSQAGGTALNVTDMSRVRVTSGITLTASVISGTGEMVQDVGPNPADFGTIIADIVDFAKDPDNGWFFWIQANGTTVVNDFDAYPTFRTFGGNASRFFQFGKDILAQNMLIDNNVTFQVANNLTVERSIIVGSNQEGFIEFPNNGTNVTLECTDLQFIGGADSDPNAITVANAGSDEHTFRIKGNITFDNGTTFDLRSASGSNVILELAGAGTHALTNNTAIVMDLHKLVLNKGTDITSSFEFPDQFTITDPAVTGFQPIEVVNGKLILNDPAIDVKLTDASTGNFLLPNTLNSQASSGSGGIELRQGLLRIEGDDTGMILDGCLTISGGTLNMATGVGNGNNFIEYSSSGNASITVSAGALEVGSQVRRNLTAITGELDYTQTGGTARFGVTAAPEASRGVFEILNAGSSFTHTGGDFTIVRQNGSTTVGSLIMQPETYNFSGSTITIGDGSTPAGQNDIGINATVPMNTLLITGNNNLTAKEFVNPLTTANLTINPNGTFDANGWNLTVVDAFTNNGTFVSSGNGFNNQTTFFPTTTSQTISGTGTSTFYNLTQSGVGGTLNVSKDITVTGILTVSNATATLSTGTSSVNAQADVVLQGNHTSAVAGPGIVFNGTSAQNFARLTSGESSLGTITIDNSNGVNVNVDNHDFLVDHKVILSAGVFNIGSNLLTLDEDAIIENGTGGTAVSDFSVNNMISVNTSLIDKGLRKRYTSGAAATTVFPVGLLYYTPVVVNSTNITGTNPVITIKPIDDIAGGIADDDDTDACGALTEYDDTEAVLQYYWAVKSTGITDFDGEFTMYHANALESLPTVNPNGFTLANYAPARLLTADNNWDKVYSQDLFDEASNTISFKVNSTTDYANFTSDDIQGLYTAGVTKDNADITLCGTTGAIPDEVPQYITNTDGGTGNISDNIPFNGTGGSGGGAPGIGLSPDLVVSAGYTLNLNDDFRRFRKVEIQAGATLVIDGTIGHNLGTVIGAGQIKLIKDGAANPSLPAGDYDDYFPNNDCTGGQGGLTYENQTGDDLTILAGLNAPIYRVTLQGTGPKVLVGSGASITICENLQLEGGNFDMSDNSVITVKGNVIKTAGASFNSAWYANSSIILSGTSQQLIDGDFTGAQRFNSLTIDNADGVTVVNAGGDDAEADNLVFSNGLLTTDATNRFIINEGGSVTGYDATKFVNGPLVRELSPTTSTEQFPFPVGGFTGFGMGYGLISVRDVQFGTGSGAAEFTATYFYAQPSQNGFVTPTTGGANSTDDSFFSTAMTSAGVEKISDAEYWTVDAPSARNATSQLNMNWTALSDVQDPTNLRIVYWNSAGTNWNILTTGSPVGSGTSGTIATTQAVGYSTNVVTFGTTNAVDTPLPIELLDFTAEKFGEKEVEVLWTTATEFNNDYFVVEHSVDGQNFQAVGQIKGAGDSEEMKAYRFVHEEPVNGSNYYRLKQVDFDGSFSFSRVANVDMEGLEDLNAEHEPAAVSAFPNPVRSGYELGVEAKNLMPETRHEIQLVDLTGRIITVQVSDSDLAGNLSAKLRVGGELQTGMYLLRLTDGGHVYTKKISVMR